MIDRRFVDLYTHCRIAKTIDADNQVTSWADYEEEDLHKPLPVSTGGSAGFYLDQSALAYRYDYFTPRKGREWSEMEVDVDYSEFTGLTAFGKMPRFISVDVQSTDGTNYNAMTVYGWIDDISPVATKGPKANTLIRWHVDYWLTIANGLDMKRLDAALWADWNVAFGQGRIRRGPVELARPDPSSPRMWLNDSVINLEKVNDTDGPYVIMLYTTTNNGITLFHIAWWGVNMASIGSYTPINFDLIYSGFVEEAMNIAASSIVGVWFSPIPPHTTGGSTIQHHQLANVDYGWYDYQAGTGTPYTYTITLNPTIKTDDLQKYILVDPKGTVYATLPWGIECDRIQISADVGSSGAWLDVEFMDGASYIPGEGRRAQIPLISAPITSNDWNEYVLSGQREYDKDMARIQQEKNAWSGVANLGGSIVGGAIGGAIAGGPGGAAAGAAGGIVSGTVGTAGNFWLTEIYDAKAQDKMDKLTSNQTASVIISGGGNNWYKVYAGKWILAKMVRDDVSAAELSAEQSELGYVTDTYSPDCNTFILTGGPMRIEGLQVRGDVNREGKAYLRALFERGVNIDVITLNWS